MKEKRKKRAIGIFRRFVQSAELLFIKQKLKESCLKFNA